MTASIVDVSSACGDKAGLIYAAGVRTVIRYYSRDTIRPSKRLAVTEARALARSGLRLGMHPEVGIGEGLGRFSGPSRVYNRVLRSSWGVGKRYREVLGREAFTSPLRRLRAQRVAIR